MKKRLISMLAATACVALLCGCGDNAQKESGQESQTSVSENEVADASGNEAKFQYNPEDYVTLSEYKGMEISVPAKVEFEEYEYDLETKSYYFSYITEQEGITDRAVELYDMTNIDYEGKKDGVAFEGGTAQGATLLIGSGQFIDGFEEGLIGVMPGETVDLNLKFPENYGSADLAGQDVVFTVTVNFIPEMKDERVAELGVADVTNVEELKQYVKDAMNKQAESEYITTAGTVIMQQLIAEAQFGEIPEELLEENRQTYINYLEQQAAYYGMDGQTYVATYGGGVEYDALVEEYATAFTKELLVVRAIAQKEGLELTDEAVDARLEEYGASVGRTVDELLVNGVTKEDYKDSFTYDDVMTFLVENAVNTPVE